MVHSSSIYFFNKLWWFIDEKCTLSTFSTWLTMNSQSHYLYWRKLLCRHIQMFCICDIMQMLITVVGLRLKAISYILVEWCSLLLFIICDISPGSGHHLPWPPTAASILQAARLCPQKPVWNGPISAVRRQWYSLLVSKNIRLFLLILYRDFPSLWRDIFGIGPAP